jgi:hypothetical protein
MRDGRIVRSLALIATASLVLGAFVAGPADAKKKKKKPKVATCAPFTPVAPASNSGETAEAAEAPVVQVTSAATEEKPIVVEYEHGAAFWETVTQTPVQEDTQFFNFQVVGTGGLHLRMDFSPESDLDMYLYDGASGARVASSGAANQAMVAGDPTGLGLDANGNGGPGFESIPGYAASNCAGYTVESRAFMSPGTPVTLKVWLGEVGENIPE